MAGPSPNADTALSHMDYRTLANNTHRNWWQDPCLRKNVFYCIGLCGTLFFNGYDGALFNSLQTITAWQEYFSYPEGNTLGLMNSAALFPGVVTPFFAEQVANRWGRRWAVWIGVWINVVGAAVNASATSLEMYIAGRAVMGVGISMGLTIAPTLLQEFAHPRYRAPLGTLYTSIYYIAAVIAAGVCLGTRYIETDAAWRVPCWLQLVGPLATFAMIVTMPESPRWLVKHGRQAEALRILAKYHANGNELDPLVQMEISEIIEGIEMEQYNNQAKYTDYFKKENHHRLFLLIAVAAGTNWVGNGIISYYLTPILNQIGVTSTLQQAGLNLGLQCWNLIISTAAGLNCDRFGRRPLWLTSNVGMLFCLAIVMGLSGAYAELGGNPAVGQAVIPFLFLFFGFYDMSWTPLANMYTVEILPYMLRAKGQAIYNVAQALANAVNQWVNPIVLEAIEWRYYGVYLAILAAYVVMIYFWFPETRNLTIEEIAVVFDGARAGAVRNVAQTVGRKTAMEDDAVSVGHDEAPRAGPSGGRTI